MDAQFLLKSNRKSYALYRMVTLPMTLSDPRALTTPISTLCTAFHILAISVVRNFIFGLQVSGSKSQPADDKSALIGACSGSRDTFQNFTPPKIYLKRLKLETSNFVH